MTAYTVGAIGSSLITMAWPPKRRCGASLVLGTLVAGLCVAGIGFVHQLAYAIALYVLMGIATGQFSVVLISMLQRWSEPALIGRVFAVLSIVTFGAAPLGNLFTGVLIEHLSLGVTMTIFGLLSIACALLAVTTPQLRQANLE